MEWVLGWVGEADMKKGHEVYLVAGTEVERILRITP